MKQKQTSLSLRYRVWANITLQQKYYEYCMSAFNELMIFCQARLSSISPKKLRDISDIKQLETINKVRKSFLKTKSLVTIKVHISILC